MNFNLMINFLAARMIMRSKFLIMLFWISISWSKIWPPDQNCQILMNKFDLMNKLNFNLMIKNSISWKSWILISWNSTSWSFPFCYTNLTNLINCYLKFHRFPILLTIETVNMIRLLSFNDYWYWSLFLIYWWNKYK